MVTFGAAIVVVVVVTVVHGHCRCCGCASPLVVLLALFVGIVDDSQPHPYLEGDPALYV